MSLATRCSACGTVFRVVQDQLRVSEGWVRCGRCSEVFNAHEALFDLERDRPPPWAGAGGSAGEGDPTFDAGLGAAASADLPEALAADASDPQLVDRIDAALFGSRGGPAEPAHLRDAGFAAKSASAPSENVPTPPLGSELAADRTGVPVDDAVATASFEDARADADAARDERPEPTLGDAPPASSPAFLRDAERAERWKGSRARLVLALGCTLLLALLAAQLLYHFRDVLAARWPGARPAFVAGCALLDCRVEAPRRIEDMSVESTTLTRAGGVDAFRLAVTLRNHGTLALAPPSIDLTLTDSSGALLARRALAPADFRAPPGPLAPGAESAWQLLLSAGTPRVSGYTVEIFYP